MGQGTCGIQNTVVVAALVLGGTYPLAACSCLFPDPQTALKQSDLVFRGTIVKVEYVDSPLSVAHIFAKNRMMSAQRRFLARRLAQVEPGE